MLEQGQHPNGDGPAQSQSLTIHAQASPVKGMSGERKALIGLVAVLLVGGGIYAFRGAASSDPALTPATAKMHGCSYTPGSLICDWEATNPNSVKINIVPHFQLGTLDIPSDNEPIPMYGGGTDHYTATLDVALQDYYQHMSDHVTVTVDTTKG